MRLVVTLATGKVVDFRVGVHDADAAFDKARHEPGVACVELWTGNRRGHSRRLRRFEPSGNRFTFTKGV